MKKLIETLKRKWVEYLLEILVVTIGILGAFLLNNWNETRKNKNTEKEYISRLTNELKADIQYYEVVRNQFLRKEEQLNRIIVIWQSNVPSSIDSLEYINDFWSAGDNDPWYTAPVTWAQLIQTGDLKLFKDQQLVDDLYTYYNLVKKRADNFLLHPMDVTNQARERWSKAFKYENPNTFSYIGGFESAPNAKIYEQIWNNRDEYLELYLTIAFSSKAQHNLMQEIIDTAQILLNNLKEK